VKHETAIFPDLNQVFSQWLVSLESNLNFNDAHKLNDETYFQPSQDIIDIIMAVGAVEQKNGIEMAQQVYEI
jgi:hypothetical protein